ncbi:arrestin (or S-antigen), N-terminal domain protein [Aspergillus nomiae NRRL 13137]|uniref:Arrestin (Or S-antigen), N-terminal domain protein n=1 Tax=Aspergillus nomiae NRRL (strain ATCC 15546 / NRRL 13137 / CBS 260.88 / M93) TaxID=1509407 RepID=A0A0L1JER2_ASPN3|nr:arrestin (or S-antigen), N-terminal domain protein [Aspergillus nomiae NRRL 13137]KNG90309.1 arrestin (or S-antigen), N-terminal domain protein [Aspergillus nomiae NRRL 13137]
MSATLYIDSPHTHFTNLDFLTGKVVVKLTSETQISGIQVKLEGESRTRLSGPRHPHHEQSDKKRTEIEVHKILYKILNLFPTPAVFNENTPNTVWTFAAGTYEYPFQFKFPFNNACSFQNSMLTNLNISGLKVEVARDTHRHVKKTLPPSLSGFPQMADIKYYVKATVIRPQFYKENIRTITNINFLPIEPPRTGNPGEETYARRQHQFAKAPSTSKMKSLFQKSSSSSLRDSSSDSPRVSADIRLPNPSILTCNEPIPLRILVSKTSESYETIFLQTLQIELIGYTNILAHDLKRNETNTSVIFSRSNMAIPLGRGGDPVGTEWTIDASMWSHIPLPSSIAPTFETCNISRTYELEVRVGLSHGTVGNMKPQLIVLPLRMPVKVYSGISPPQALLDAMAQSGHIHPTVSPTKPSRPSQEASAPPPMPPRPTRPPAPLNPEDGYDDAPPSYEDAMAETLSPVDGPRREYNPPAASSTGRPIEFGTDPSTPVQPGKDPEPRAPYSNREANSSSESFDMLPSTPPEPQTGSPPTSPVARQQSVLKIHKLAALQEDSPPQYQPVADHQPQSPGSQVQPNSSRPDVRALKLGVPNRKPVPRGPNSGDA